MHILKTICATIIMQLGVGKLRTQGDNVVHFFGGCSETLSEQEGLEVMKRKEFVN